jgi:NitT/TauT family transport system substrate-binding protein
VRTLRLLAVVAVLASATHHAARATDTFKVATAQRGFWDTTILLYGDRQGFFKDAGLDLDISWTNGGAETEQAVISGSVDVGCANGILGVVAAYAKGVPVRIVAAETTGVSDLFWYAKAESGLKSFGNLEGKTVGFSSPGSSSNMVALALIDQARVKAKPVPTGGAPATLTQVMSGQIDVGWAVPPLHFDLLDQGKLFIIGRGSDVAAMRDQTVRVFEATADTLKTRRGLLVRFFKAYQKTLDWAYADPKAIEYFAADNKVTVEQAKRAIEQFYPKAALSLAPISNLDLTVKQAIELKRLPAPLTPEQVKELIDIVYDPTK